MTSRSTRNPSRTSQSVLGWLSTAPRRNPKRRRKMELNAEQAERVDALWRETFEPNWAGASRRVIHGDNVIPHEEYL